MVKQRFYGCYLLHSLHRQSKNRTYIGCAARSAPRDGLSSGPCSKALALPFSPAQFHGESSAAHSPAQWRAEERCLEDQQAPSLGDGPGGLR